MPRGGKRIGAGRRKLDPYSRVQLGAVCENRLNGIVQAEHDKRLKKRRGRKFFGMLEAPQKLPPAGSRDRIIGDVAKEASEQWGIPISPRLVLTCWLEYRKLTL